MGLTSDFFFIKFARNISEKSLSWFWEKLITDLLTYWHTMSATQWQRQFCRTLFSGRRELENKQSSVYSVNEQLQPKNVKLAILRIDSIKMKNTCKTRIKRYAEMESPRKFFFQQWNTVILSPNITQELWLFIQLGFQQNVNDSLNRNYFLNQLW